METKKITEPIETLVKKTEEKPAPLENIKTSLSKFKLSPKNKTMLIIAGGLVLVVIILLVLQKTIVSEPLPEPTPIPTATPTEIPESAYATDSAVLKLETDLNDLEKNLQSTSFRDSALLLPKIDMDVKFNVND